MGCFVQFQPHPPQQFSLPNSARMASQGITSVQAAFDNAAAQGRAAFVPYITAGFPTLDATVSILKGMEEGGADVIEVCVTALAEFETV